MWNGLSLRMRLFLPLGIMFLAALLLGGVALQVFATGQLADEKEQPTKSAKAVADALNSALASSDNPDRVLQAFVQGLGKSEAIHFRPVGTSPVHAEPEVRTPLGRVPRWFVHLLTTPEIGAAFPVMLEGKGAGDIVFSPDLSADIFEKWIGFLAIVCSGIVLMGLTGAIAYFTAGTTLGPLQALSAGLTRMRQGHYDRRIPPSGPPEIAGVARKPMNWPARSMR